MIRRDWIRAAGVIAGGLQREAPWPPELPTAAWQRCRRLQGLLTQAQQRGWRHAERRCRDRLRRTLADLRRQLDDGDFAREENRYQPSLRDLYDDLRALENEFPGLTMNLKEGTLSVVTESIVLEGIDLGPFEIELDWRRLPSPAYVVRALRGNGAAGDDSVVHPHVRDDQLCEGDAHGAIRAALRSGRLLDFFTVVAQTLATYNPQSAYVSLDQWEGTPCADCGASVTDDEGGTCERCSSSLCGDCDCSCSSCGRTACSDCGASCLGCREHHCERCLADCSICQKTFCERCLDEEQCPACRDAAAEGLAATTGQAPPDSPPTGPSGDSAHPLCLGQAPLPA